MYAAAVPTMPPGLVQLMEGLAKDVLKNSPDNIYEFCAQHMKLLIEIRDGKARTNYSPSVVKISRNKEKVKAEITQNVNATDLVVVATNYITDKKDKSVDEKPGTDENYVNNSFEIETEIEQKQFHIEENTFDSNKHTTGESVDDDVKLPHAETMEKMLCPLAKSFNENTMDTSLSMTNLGSSISEKESEDKIKLSEGTTNSIKNDNSFSSETNFLEVDSLSKDKSQLQPSKSFDSGTDLQSVDKAIPENTYDNLNLINNLNNANSPQKELSENEVLGNDSIDDLTVQNKENEQLINHQPIDDMNINDGLHFKKSNDTEDSSKEISTDVNNEASISMDLEKAAVTIQKVFRAFLFKSKTLSTDDATNIDLNYLVENKVKEAVIDPSTANKERRSGISRMDTVLQTVNEEKSLSLSTDDSSTLSSAATIIQAHVRGFLVRCKMPFNKTISTVSVLDSDIPSAASLDSDQNQQANKTILNIHIVPEGNNLISRDESFMTSLDLSSDGSPHHSSNLHPLGYDRNERRKQLKREDAIQSVTPPSNNSGKLSEEVDSVKETALSGSNDEPNLEMLEIKNDLKTDVDLSQFETHEPDTRLEHSKNKFIGMRNVTSDETDVVTPFAIDGPSVESVSKTSKLLHSGEFHDIVLPTMVSRNNSSVVREFQNVLVYFLLWNPS